MNCTNCGTYNNPQSKFCIKCGNALNTDKLNQTMSNELNQNVITQQNYQQVVQPQMQQPINNVEISQTVNVNTSPLNYLMYLIAVLIKPFQCFKEEESKLSNGKTSIILTLIVTVIMTLANLIKTIIFTVRVADISLFEGSSYKWQWENLKYIKWVEVIGKNFLIYAGIILAITIVFYFGGLVLKKQVSFVKSLSISATSVIPAVCAVMILSPILGMIWSPLSMVLTIIGFAYSLIILYELMNSELNLEKDKKIYFNLVCFGLLIIAGYYAYMKLFISPVVDELGSVLDFLN